MDERTKEFLEANLLYIKYIPNKFQFQRINEKLFRFLCSYTEIRSYLVLARVTFYSIGFFSRLAQNMSKAHTYLTLMSTLGDSIGIIPARKSEMGVWEGLFLPLLTLDILKL